jgi:NTP pyrophosphatase (non-canonical NTP hydrolase)
MPQDETTTIATLRKLIREFVAERRWEVFHTPKNLAMALAIEAAELMEHFQWLTPEESRDVARRPEALAAVGEELADVLCYALAMANELGLDVATIVTNKMAKNARKYPVHEYRGRYGANDPRPASGP